MSSSTMSALLPTPLESAQTTIFNIISSLGIFSTVLVLVPAWLCPHIKRPRIWFGVLTSYLVYSVINLLLVGRQFEPEPPLGLCFFQAILIYGIVPVSGVSTACFALDFYLKLSPLRPRDRRINPKTHSFLVYMPWTFGLLVTIVSALCVDNVSRVQPDPNHFYCHITTPIPSLINVVIILLCALFISVLQTYVAVFLYRNWAAFKQISKDQPQIAFSTFVRLSLFSLIVTAAIVLSITAAIDPFKDTAPAWNIVLAALPTLSALCFGAHKDILLGWLFWRRKEQTSSIPAATSDVFSLNERRRMTFDV